MGAEVSNSSWPQDSAEAPGRGVMVVVLVVCPRATAPSVFLGAAGQTKGVSVVVARTLTALTGLGGTGGVNVPHQARLTTAASSTADRSRLAALLMFLGGVRGGVPQIMCIAVAATGVEGLKTIIPEADICNWYSYYRYGGLVLPAMDWQGDDLDILAKYCFSRAKDADDYARIKDGYAQALADLEARENRDCVVRLLYANEGDCRNPFC